MKRFAKTICALSLALLAVIPTCFAATKSASYSISNSGTTWNGKSNDVLWVLNDSEATFMATITSSETRSISGTLKYIREYFPDSTLATLTVTGKNGASGASAPFYPNDTDAGHYAIITITSGKGVQGKVSVTQ